MCQKYINNLENINKSTDNTATDCSPQHTRFEASEWYNVEQVTIHLSVSSTVNISFVRTNEPTLVHYY